MPPFEELHDEFLAEAKEHIETIEKELLDAEKHPDAVNSEQIAGIFRAIHSIKGAAGFMGFDNISALSHTMETLLHMMRHGEIQPEAVYIDALLSGCDILQSMLDDLRSSNDVDIRSINDRILLLIENRSTPETKKEIESRIVMHDTKGMETGFEINEYVLKNIPEELNYLYVLNYDLHKIQKEKKLSPVRLNRALRHHGFIIETRIETNAVNLEENLSELPFIYRILFASKLEAEELSGLAGIECDQMVEIQKKGSPLPPMEPSQEPETLASPPPECAPVPIESTESAKTYDNRESSETVRISIDILDKMMKLAGELVLIRNQQLLALEQSDVGTQAILKRLDVVTTELQETIMRTRMQPIGNIFSKLNRLVRDLSRKLHKKIELQTFGNDVELDKTILESLVDPLLHLIRNCCDHGIEPESQRRKLGKPETGQVTIHAFHEAGLINIRISDDGRGMDHVKIRKRALGTGLKTEPEIEHMTEKEFLALTFLPGFSTADALSDVSGRGVGMDVVKTAVEHIGGSIEIDSVINRGTTIHLKLPLTLAIIPCLIVKVGDYRYAIPQVNLVELVCLYDSDVYTKIESTGDQEVFRLRKQLLPMVRLNEVLSRPIRFTDDTRRKITKTYSEIAAHALNETQINTSCNFAVVKFDSHQFGVIVDQVLGTEEIVVKPMHPSLKFVDIYCGATVMGDGKVALILDIEGIARHANIHFLSDWKEKDEETARTDANQTVLLFKSGDKELFAVALPMIRRIERIAMSDIEWIGKRAFITIDGVSTLILYLHEILNVSPLIQKDEMLILLPKHIKRPFGVLMSSVIDISETPMNLNIDTYMEDGLMGSAIVRNKMTLFLDLYRLIELAEPEWFAERRKAAPPPEDKKYILLAEDTAFFRQLVKGYLESDQYEVMTAENGKIALELLNQKRFDLIVSDLEMPVMNGWEFVRCVRNDSSCPNIPAIALTALDSEADRERAFNVGFNAYEVKLDREQLLSNVSNLLNK